MEEKEPVETKISIRKSGGKKGYESAWIYIPTRVYNDSSFPFKKNDKLIIQVKDNSLTIRKKQLFEDIINKYGLENANLPVLVEKKAIENKGQPAIYFKDDVITFDEINKNSNKIAHGIREIMKKYNLKKNHVAVLFENNPFFVYTCIGIAKAGAVYVPINYFLRGETLRFLLDQSDAEVLIIDHKFYRNFKKIRDKLQKLKLIVVLNPPDTFKFPENCINFDEINTKNTENPKNSIKFTHPMEILFTEGTTGIPKAILYRHQFIIAGLILYEEIKNIIKPLRNIYLIPPLFHYLAQIFTFMQLFFSNGAIVLVDNFDPSKIWQDAKKYKSNALIFYGGIIPALLNQPPSEQEQDHGIKWAIGGETPKELWEIFENRFGIEIYEGWASTEAMGYTINKIGSKGGKAGSIGKPIEVFEIKIIDLNGNELPPGPDNIGEIISKPNLPMKLEYYKDPVNTPMIP